MKLFAIPSVIFLSMLLGSCGGGSSHDPQPGALAGNWQMNLTQEYPRPGALLSVSGFLSQSSSTVTGSVQVPQSTQNGHCGGVGSVAGAVSGQTVNLVINNGGAEVNLTGTLSSDGQSMSGGYTGQAGGCFTAATSGTWTATLIPPLNGTFTGVLTGSTYMGNLTGETGNPPSIGVTGTFTQTGGPGASNATITGTIEASNYPCFRTATFSGTISGANVYLQVFSYNGSQIGLIGIPPVNPATVVVNPQGSLSLVGLGANGLTLGGFFNGIPFGPCPPLQTANGPQPNDSTSINLTLDGTSNLRQNTPK